MHFNGISTEANGYFVYNVAYKLYFEPISLWAKFCKWVSQYISGAYPSGILGNGTVSVPTELDNPEGLSNAEGVIKFALWGETEQERYWRGKIQLERVEIATWTLQGRPKVDQDSEDRLKPGAVFRPYVTKAAFFQQLEIAWR